MPSPSPESLFLLTIMLKIYIKYLFKIYFYVYECFCLFIFKCTECGPGAHRDQKRILNLLELELRKVVSHRRWVLKTKPESSARRASAPNH